MTYTVLSGTLNSTIPNHTSLTSLDTKVWTCMHVQWDFTGSTADAAGDLYGSLLDMNVQYVND